MDKPGFLFQTTEELNLFKYYVQYLKQASETTLTTINKNWLCRYLHKNQLSVYENLNELTDKLLVVLNNNEFIVLKTLDDINTFYFITDTTKLKFTLEVFASIVTKEDYDKTINLLNKLHLSIRYHYS